MCLILTQNFALPVLSDIWHFPPQWKHRYKFSWQHRQGVVWQGVFSCGQRAPPSERVAREICPKCIQSLHTPRGFKLVPQWAINRKPNTWHTLKSPLISTFPESHLVWCNQAISEKAMAPHSSTFAWKIPQTEEPGGLQSMGSLRVGYDWAASLSLFTFIHWTRKWQPTPVFLLGESQGRRRLVGFRLWGCTESDTTKAT